MRLIFIPGFGETKHIFTQIAPHLPGEHLFIENQDLLGMKPTPSITAIGYAQRLIEQHTITRQDYVIGHSMGGWVAYAIKHLVGCPIIQIASWTDPEKVVLPIKKPEIIYWLVRNGLYLNRLNKKLLLRFYRDQPSAPVFSEVFQHLIDSPAEYVLNQLRVILNPVETTITVQPDVVIHSKKDSIIRFPDGQVSTVPGDHFNLFTYPAEVLAVMTPLFTAS